MRFGHIEIFVENPLGSLSFYRDILGMRMVETQGNGSAVWVQLRNTQILLRRGKRRTAANIYRDAQFGIVLYSSSLDRDIEDLLKRGLRFSGDDGSSRERTFVDPDGNWFQIVDPRDFS